MSVDPGAAGPVRILLHPEHSVAAVPVQRGGKGGEELPSRDRVRVGAGLPGEDAAVGDVPLVALAGHQSQQQ